MKMQILPHAIEPRISLHQEQTGPGIYCQVACATIPVIAANDMSIRSRGDVAAICALIAPDAQILSPFLG